MTKRQFQILSAILRFQREHGYPPSQREVAKAVGISAEKVWFAEKGLKAEGYLQRDGYMHSARRCLRVLKMPGEIIWQMVDGELVLGPLGRARLAASRQSSAL